MQKLNKVLISGGGTGGHIFPALSIANALKRRMPDVEILFVGADNRMEMQRVPAAGYQIIGLPVSGFNRKKPWRNFKVLWRLWKSMRKANRIVRDFKPDIAIGVGGYASGPTLKAAQKHGIPTLIQEQNSYPGVTNKLLAKEAKAICVAYPGLEKYFPAEKLVLTGNPCRAYLSECILSQAQAKEALGFQPNRPLVLVVGGSLGARTINDSVKAALSLLTENGAQLLWQTGNLQAGVCQEAATHYPGVKAMPFISDMATAYRAADIVVSRAGAGTISELENLGKAAILVPSPNVAEDHQRHNAEALTTHDAAIMVLDINAPKDLPQAILDLLNDETKRQALSQNITKLAKLNSDEKIVDKIIEIGNK